MLSLQRTSNSYDKLGTDMNLYIQQQKTLGVNPLEIKTQLLKDLQNQTGVFREVFSSLRNERQGDYNVTAEVSSNQFVEDETLKYEWYLDPDVREHCVDCLANADEVGKSYKAWEKIGLPATGHTECGIWCKCTLVPSEDGGEGILEKDISQESIVGKHKSVADAKKWAEANGVISNVIDRIPLDTANEINKAISNMPIKYRKNLAVGDFKYFKEATGRKLTKVEMNNYGVNMTISGFDFQLLSLKEKIKLEKLGKLNEYRIVAINTEKYKTMDEMANRKILMNKEYLKATGNNFVLNTFKGSTIHHEFGHSIHTKLSVEMNREWNMLARDWSNNAKIDYIKKTNMGGNYGEAFAEAWACFTKGNKSLLPEKIIKFMEKL